MLEQIKQSSLGNWQSIAVEIRPSSLKNEDGTLKPFYLKRLFSFLPEDRFELEITNYADPFGEIPTAKMFIKGHVEWKGAHPIAEGAQKVDFTADESYEVTSLHQGFTDLLNNLAKERFENWETGKSQDILKKKFPPFGLAEGQIFKEYDLIYIVKNMMFWGARNIDGRGFDTEENRPTNLQIPMIRK
ncbi:hypothetical protein N0B40_19760 [Chryseobacterium oranimense]|uniref:hypothetical protein n=1 Tax=Chryseobacterium oranimense TaxID=421058 RepID=UPI0021AF6AF6|nr:hypothetical protein [Chryseobacterium oranimense]UWX60611.1 hypothetical protein N0B40_19760 [Chryseobacterium oranimense]